MSDAEYVNRCEQQRIASAKLRDAILAARAGTHPATSPNPVKLPPDPRISRENGRKAAEVIQRLETREEAIIRLFSAGRTRQTIACELGIESWHEVDGFLRTFKNCEPRRYWHAVERHNRARGIVK